MSLRVRVAAWCAPVSSILSLAVLILAADATAAAGPVVKAKRPRSQPPAVLPERSIVIPAYSFNRGNAQTFSDRWADAEPMIGYGGQSPLFVEYDLELPVAGQYTVYFRYSAAGSRPIDLFLDNRPSGKCCQGVTGTWNTSGAAWEETLKVDLSAGKHTLKLESQGAIPHIVTLRLDSSVPFPKGWTLKRPGARTLKSPPPAPVLALYRPRQIDPQALGRAIDDLQQTFGNRYPKAAEYRRQLEVLVAQLKPLETDADSIRKNQARLKEIYQSLSDLQDTALLANPLLDFPRLLLVKRHNKGPQLGLPRNWQSNSSLPKTGYDDEIAVLSPVRPDGQITPLYQPPKGRFVGDVDLHFDASRMLFSMVDDKGRWQVFEVGANGQGLRQVTGDQPDVDSYDACYLPDDRLLVTSTASFVGVPCVYGSSHVATIYRMDADGKNIRQLCFDQEHDWCPTVLNNGRVLYTRWEYTDTPHSNTRLLFHMNPDGTEQMEYVGSNSYWPNAFFYARPIPGHPTKVLAVIGGHHDNPRMGELVLFDPALGRFEAESAIQRIPGFGKKVEPIIRDGLTTTSWPKFLHPYPLSDKYFLVACKPTPQSLWGIYLADVFDNLVPIRQLDDYALLEPIPFRPTPTPPKVPDKVDPTRTDALVYLPDIYIGDGLKGVPRGTVKHLRIFTYHYAYQGMGGLLGVVGMDGPWDIKRVLGTVPVESDGSAKFRIPANVPVSLQPLDAEGKALQLMRSWMTAMPGEVVQCGGCHERQNTAPPMKSTLALNKKPDTITPWRGPTRGFAYAREVQPVIDRFCVGCHDGSPRPNGRPIPNLRGDQRITDWKSVTPGNGGGHAGKFSVGYAELHRYVRRPGIESDYHLLEPMEFHADTTHLVQMLQAGHYGVKLDAEGWDRLVTWIDLNCPFHGTWGEELDKPGVQRDRRRELLKLYANVDDDPEAVPQMATPALPPIIPAQTAEAAPAGLACAGWPFDADEAARRQQSLGSENRWTIDLGEGAAVEMVRIPPGEFVMGSATGMPNERPLSRVRITQPYWIARLETTNLVYQRFDPRHDSRVEDKNTYQFGIHGFPVNLPEQPVVRVSWNEAMAFCRWLSQKTGRQFSLPTEAQWEYACRAGSAQPFWYGDFNVDFSKRANLSDARMSDFASHPYTVDTPLKNPTKYDDWIPKDSRFDDGALLTVAPGRYQPNPWGLCDMHGNAAEWTRSAYRPYPYRAEDGRDTAGADGRKVVRGGSWRDEPKRSTASFRLSYLSYQRVFNVGFRVVCEDQAPAVARAAR